jgi:hypothetical protein
MKWGKDPDQRARFGLWLDVRNITQTEVSSASGLGDSIISTMCNDHTYKPSYLTFRKLKVGLGILGYPEIKYDDFWS